jgi:hypothetical protein
MLMVCQQRLNDKAAFIAKPHGLDAIMVSLVDFVPDYALGLRDHIAFNSE